MKSNFLILGLVLGISFSFAFARNAFPPDTLAPRTEIEGMSSDSAQYFIRILPTDSTFKDNMPIYNPDKQHVFTTDDSLEIIYKPRIEYPNDPSLHRTLALVRLNVLVDGHGSVREAKVMSSTDHAFDAYALEYAKQYRFRWKNWKISHLSWASIAIAFKK